MTIQDHSMFMQMDRLTFIGTISFLVFDSLIATARLHTCQSTHMHSNMYKHIHTQNTTIWLPRNACKQQEFTLIRFHPSQVVFEKWFYNERFASF